MRNFLLIPLLFLHLASLSQGRSYFSKYTYYGLGWVSTDDNANASPELIPTSSNTSAFPTLLTVGTILSNSIRLEGSLFGVPLNRETYGARYVPPGYMASVDFNASRMIIVVDRRNDNFLSRNFLSNFAIQAYPCFGLGYTYRTLIDEFQHSMMINVGCGGIVWTKDNRWGVCLQSLAKFGVKGEFPKHGSNYIQTSVSLLYKVRNWTDQRWERSDKP